MLDLAPTTASSFADKGEGVGGGFVAPKPTEASPAPPQQEASIAPPPPKPAKPNAQPKEAARMPVVVIDAGHGGVDPGATGVSGIYEKHITLAVARQLRDSLVATGRYRVVLTRDRDVFIPLRKRVEIARAAGGDLFLSIHSDSIDNPKTRGLSVYTLSENASDVEAGLLAERENKVDLIAGMDLSSESREVTDILIDLAQRETMNLSARYASFAVGELRREAKLLGRTHRFASFAVLKAPDIPSVLLEIGYLSHKDEERQLREKDYRAKLARSITKSVDQFFAQAQKALLP
ncbi:MAG: hypothetical protein A2516_04095 [Alphaproteobacteria bacterium RIFOXYD12_FULL_60_8]|nr:MAG: hypothetical protein A2516_04095 [Alphaproteobacteria bacterium RIFOXYD12_FULL_60_8]